MTDASRQISGIQRIFLTGLSGVGKTTLGQRVASLLDWRFVDTDDVLAERVGMPVGQVLVEYGEERFRELESEVLRRVGEEKLLIIATGGGMVISPANRQFMREQGLVVYLYAPIATIWQRAHAARGQVMRPLIAGDDGEVRLRALFARRQPWYEEAPIHLDTATGSEEELASQLISRAFTPHSPGR